jgi:hypothetical protein
MKSLKEKIKSEIRDIIKVRRGGTEYNCSIPTKNVIYGLRIRKNIPTNDYIVCPDDYFEIEGSITVLESIFEIDAWEDYGYDNNPNMTRFKLEESKIVLKNYEKQIKRNKGLIEALEDVVKIIKEIKKTTITVMVEDKEETDKNYKAKRKEIREELKQTDPSVSGYDLRVRVDEAIRNFESTKYKKLMEV